MSLGKTPHVKNPLTIIAVFAGIAEVSGTVVVSFLLENQQAVFVWFLIIFPILLVLLFFLTLNFNPKVLYAPSDYENEDNFLKVHRFDPSTRSEISEDVVVERSAVNPHADFVEDIGNLPSYPLKVSVSNFSNADKFISRLRNQGYLAEVYNTDIEKSSLEEHEAIWVGENVDPRSVVDVLKKAIDFYPHLKFIHLSRDDGVEPPEYVHHQIYVGGSSSTAKRYQLRPVPHNMIKSLTKDVSRSDLHKFIRSYYGSS